MQGWAMVDGRLCRLEDAVVPASDLGLLRGWSVFETMELLPGQFVGPHLARLEGSCNVGGIPGFNEGLLREEIGALVQRVGERSSVRVTMTASGTRLITARPSPPKRWHAPVRCARGPHVDDPFLPGFIKHGSRMGWERQVARLGVDDVLRVADGRFTEGTRSGVVAVVDGVLWTHAHDGRVLPSTTVNRLLGHSDALGIDVRRSGALADGPWDALYIASSTRSLAPVIELDGEGLTPWDPVGTALAEADDRWAGRP